MQVVVFNKPNLNSLNEAQWSVFCKYVEPFVEAYTKFPTHSAMVNVSDDGLSATIKFEVETRESLQIVTAKFDKFICQEWEYDNLGKKRKNIPPHNVSLAWQVFLTKVFGKDYEFELKNFYNRYKISTTLINRLIKNSSNDFEI